MKIAITGHKKGIGKAFAEQLLERGHEIVGISRSDGENIRRTAHTASLIEPCDMLINNAISFYAQTELLFEVWHRWQDIKETHYIWNISTKLCEQDHDIDIKGITFRESMQYRNQKMSLELAHHQLNFQPSNIKMSLIRPGDVRTQSWSNPNSITADDYVKELLQQQDVV
jgi:short-subunit dehydrogenase|tara:strand:- start:3265 stop:3774 length:510 start_codon:yes stop_codon:yes gene_type:complete